MKKLIIFLLLIPGLCFAQEVITKSETIWRLPQRDGRIDVCEVHTDSTGAKHQVFWTSPAVKGESEAIEQVFKEAMTAHASAMANSLLDSEKQAAVAYALAGGDIAKYPYKWIKAEDVKAMVEESLTTAKVVNAEEKVKLDAATASAGSVGVKP
jgi:hypothetical protein